MKKKMLSLALAIGLSTTAIVGGTMAYFTDTDDQTNTFTVGNVAIDLWEDFGDNGSEDGEKGLEELIPATGSAQNGTLQNGIDKEVYVTNTGSEDAYIRVHIAIPTILDNGDPDFDAGKNILHFNYAKDGSTGEGLWDWSKTTGAPYDSDWNYYETTITDGEKEIPYNVYVVTYETALQADQTTVDAIHQVYLDSKVTNEDITRIKTGDADTVGLGDDWKIYVVAEGAQAAGFDNAYEALNTAFGDPTDRDYTSLIDWTAVAGEDFKEGRSVTESN